MPIIITILICATVLICVAMIVGAVEKVANLKYYGAVKRMEEVESWKGARK